MTTTLKIEQPLACTLDRAWHACADPIGIRQWQADEASGHVVAGGRMKLGWPALGVSLDLIVRDVSPRERLVFVHGNTTVTLCLSPGLVTLEHAGLPAGDELDGTASSWRSALALLAHYVEHHSERQRVVHWVVRPARATPQTVAEFFTQREALGAWLGRADASLGTDGDRYALRTAWGEAMSGRVLSNVPGRDLVVSWSEQGDSALVLRTLPGPSAPGERLIAVCWSRWNGLPAPQATLRGLDAAVTRLAHLLDGAGSA